MAEKKELFSKLFVFPLSDFIILYWSYNLLIIWSMEMQLLTMMQTVAEIMAFSLLNMKMITFKTSPNEW